MRKPKRYEIETFEQLLNVSNCENFERMMLDFVAWVNFYNHIIEECRKTHPELKEVSNWDLCKCKFIWVDDGKQTLNQVTVTNPSTGETKTYKKKKP